MRVLVCGGTEAVRRVVVDGLRAAGHHVAAPVAGSAGRPGPVDGADTVVPLDASSAGPLLALLAPARVRHLIAVSVASVMPAMGGAVAGRTTGGGAEGRAMGGAVVERAVAGAGVGWSLLRSAVPHEDLDRWLEAAAGRPFTVVPAGLRHQPVDVAELVCRVTALVKAGPAGRVPDLGGPEIVRLPDLAAAWSAARGRRVRLLAVPRRHHQGRYGAHLFPQRALPGRTWEQYLRGQRPR